MTVYTPAMVRVFPGGCFLYRINDQEVKTGDLEHKHSKPVGVSLLKNRNNLREQRCRFIQS